MAISPPGPDQLAVPHRGPREFATRFLTDEVMYLKGGGPATAQLLAKLGISTVGELLYHVPRRYEDRTNFRRIRDLRMGEPATIHGYLNAMTEEEITRDQWHRIHGPRNIAMPAGAHTADVLDIDVRADGNGWAVQEKPIAS